jgi:hypothetical protein
MSKKSLEIWMVSREYIDPDDNIYCLFLDKESAHMKYLEWLPSEDCIRDSEECRCDIHDIKYDDSEHGVKNREYFENEGIFEWYDYDIDGKNCIIFERKVVIPFGAGRCGETG